MTSRRKAAYSLMILGWILLLGATVTNLVQAANDKDISVARPIFLPLTLSIAVLGILCFIIAVIIGWNERGYYKSEVRETNEPKSRILNLSRTEKGQLIVLIRFRNGDKHPLRLEQSLADSLTPGATGTAKIRGYELLEFTPDPETKS